MPVALEQALNCPAEFVCQMALSYLRVSRCPAPAATVVAAQVDPVPGAVAAEERGAGRGQPGGGGGGGGRGQANQGVGRGQNNAPPAGGGGGGGN